MKPVRQKAPGSSRRRLIAGIAGGVSAALVVTLAVVANGFDSRETPREDPSVWVERMAGQYARVNTDTAEIDTVRVAESPSGVVQAGEVGLLLTQGYGRAHTIDATAPTDIHDEGVEDQPAQEAGGENAPAPSADSPKQSPQAEDTGKTDEGAAAMRTPDGTRQVIAAADRVLFFTQGGEVYLSAASAAAPGGSASLGVPELLDPLAEERAKAASEGGEEEAAQYLANAAAIDEQGNVAVFSQAEQSIRWFDAVTGDWVGGLESVPADVPAEGVQLAIVGEAWVLFDPETGKLWRKGVGGASTLDVVGSAQLQGSTAVEAEALVADEDGLWQIDDAGKADRVQTASGIAAQPRYVGGKAVAAWVGSTGGQLWTEENGEIELTLDDSVEDFSNPELEVRTNGSRALLVERRTGMMWTVPDGKLIPVEQWSLVDPPKQESGTVVTQDVTEQEPPVASPDAFGVRAGEPALLPVLLNDFDPNRKDVLTVVGEGLGDGIDASFGSVTMLSDGQGLVVQPSEGATGSTSFSYRITDGINVSAPATVTLTVASESVNTGPQWCPVEGCQREWPSPEVAPGGTLILPILEGWVDPEGDPMMLSAATVVNAEDPIRALVTADGRLAVRHSDPNAPSADSTVRVTLVDSRGEATERDLRVRVRTGAAIEFAPIATTAKVGEATVVRPLERVTGGSGSFEIVDATVQLGGVTAVANAGAGTVELTATAPGNAIVNVTVRDTVTSQETSGIIRITAVESRATFAVPPLRAFVRPLADSTVDVLAAVPGANSRALTVRSATVRDGQLRADVIEHSSVRISGSTPDGQPGRIGSVDVMVAENELASQGRLTVFQVGETGAGAIAVADSASVRAGSVVDIPVLDNDVSPPGERLVLHPEIGAPGVEGELAFASGSRVRYLAPKEPGVYTLSYTTYGASSPEQSDVGQVRVTVLATGSNRDPQPATVTVRVAPGEMVKTSIPLSSVDPDGDRVRLVAVDAPEDPQLSTSILARSNSVQVAASASAQRGTKLVHYTVRDSFGGQAAGTLRIIVTDPDSGGSAPVVYSDYVRLARGAADAATVRPLDNDLDPSGGSLKLVSVVPNVPGGEESPDYEALMSRLDLGEMKSGIVRVKGSDELGTVSFKYTVRSSETKSTADGLIVVQVSERIGQQAPAITDTVLSVRDRADFEKSGVDVVTDRVRWASGDISTLKLSLWGSAASRYRVNGSSIVGSYLAEGDLVPFRLSGTDVTGAEVESFGFLVVPPLDELRLSLKSNAAAISVAESKSVDVNIADMLDLGPGDKVELDQAKFTTQRQQASCEATGTTTLKYSAGKEAPWADTCTVRVRLTEQRTYTLLPVSVNIVPDEPVVQLNPLTRTIAPGAAESVNLGDMVQWQGGREGDAGKLRWQVSGGAAGFEITSSGAQVQATARADATPGSQSVLTVSVDGSGESQSLLTLRVGEAAVDAPRGGTVSLNCTVGSSCTAPLIGIGGEHDPFAGKSGGGLHLVSVDGGGCQFGTLQAAGESVSVSWADNRGPGGRCTATFTVRDAQNRTGTGTIELDAQGVPRAPVGITPVSANESSVVLSVALSSVASHPDVSGVELLAGGSPVGSCALGGGQATCTVSGLTPGQRQTYTARAVNAIGPSDPTGNGVETWAYKPPAAPAVSASTEKWPENTDPAQGRVRIEVGPSSAATRVLMIDGAQTAMSGDNLYVVSAGAHTVSAMSVDNPGMIPPGYTGSDGGQGSAGDGVPVDAIGAPIAGTAALTLSGPNRTKWEITTAGWNQNGGDALTYHFGEGHFTGNNTSGTRNGGGLTQHETYSASVTASNSYGITGIATTNSETAGNQLPRIDGTYAVNVTPDVTGWNAVYSAGAPNYTPSPTGTVNFGGVGPGNPTGTVTQCAANGANCSPAGGVTPAGLEPFQMVLNACLPWDGTTPPDVSAVNVSTLGAAGGAYTFVADTLTKNLTVNWGGTRGNITFAAGVCDPPPPGP